MAENYQQFLKAILIVKGCDNSISKFFFVAQATSYHFELFCSDLNIDF